MLRAKRLPQILSQGLCEGVHAALLLSSDGALLASATSSNDGSNVDLVIVTRRRDVLLMKQRRLMNYTSAFVLAVCVSLGCRLWLRSQRTFGTTWREQVTQKAEATSNCNQKRIYVLIVTLAVVFPFYFLFLFAALLVAAAGSKVGQLSSMLMTLTEGRVAVKSTGKGYLIAVYANRDTNVGLLLARTEALGSYFTRVFEQLNDQA